MAEVSHDAGDNKFNYLSNEFDDFLNQYELRDNNKNGLKVNEDLKKNLMTNLYATIDILKKELDEKNFVIKSLLEKFIIHRKYSCVTDSKIVETSLDQLRSIKTTENLIQLSSTLNDTFNERSNCEIPITSDITSLQSSEKDNYDNESSIKAESSKSHNTVIKEAFEEQIYDYRIHSHNKYIIEHDINKSQDVSTKSKIKDSIHKWPAKTLLIASDSIMSHIDEKRLSKNINVKLRAFSGSTIADMYFYLEPLLNKEPDYVLLHVATNDVNTNTISDNILNDLLELKRHVELKLPSCTVYISTPTIRTDNHKFNVILQNLTEKLKRLCIPLMDNSNIEPEQLGQKGLHLNGWGNSKMALNIISLIRRL